MSIQFGDRFYLSKLAKTTVPMNAYWKFAHNMPIGNIVIKYLAGYSIHQNEYEFVSNLFDDLYSLN